MIHTFFFYLQLLRASTSEEMKTLLSSPEFDFRFSNGFTRNVQQMQIKERENFIQAIWLPYVLFQPLGELDQLRQGLLDTLQVRVLSITYGKELRSPLIHSKIFEVTIDYLQEALPSTTLRMDPINEHQKKPL